MEEPPLIDRAYLDLQTFGDVALADELLDLFARQCTTLVPRIADVSRPAIERADLAHTLKGSALGIGAARVGRCAAAIEGALRGGHADVSLATLADAVADTLAELQRPA